MTGSRREFLFGVGAIGTAGAGGCTGILQEGDPPKQRQDGGTTSTGGPDGRSGDEPTAIDAITVDNARGSLTADDVEAIELRINGTTLISNDSIDQLDVTFDRFFNSGGASSMATDTNGDSENELRISDGAVEHIDVVVTIADDAGEDVHGDTLAVTTGVEVTPESAETFDGDRSAVLESPDTVTFDAETPRPRKVTHYADDGGPIVEVAFTEDLTLDGPSATLTLEDGSTVDVGSGAISATDGRLVIDTSGTVHDDVQNLTLSGVSDMEGNAVPDEAFDVRFVPSTVDASDGGDTVGASAYRGSAVALDADAPSTEIRIAGPDGFSVARNTGQNSHVFVFETADRGTGEYEIDTGGRYSGLNNDTVPYAGFNPADHHGYERWRAWNAESGNHDRLYVHRLLAVAEFGFETVNGMHVHHRNSLPWDNRPENLELLTNSEHRSLHEAEKVTS